MPNVSLSSQRNIFFQSRKWLYNHKCPLLVHQQNPSTAWNQHPSSFILHPSSFFIYPSSSIIILHSSFLHFTTCKLFSLFKCVKRNVSKEFVIREDFKIKKKLQTWNFPHVWQFYLKSSLKEVEIVVKKTSINSNRH